MIRKSASPVKLVGININARIRASQMLSRRPRGRTGAAYFELTHASNFYGLSTCRMCKGELRLRAPGIEIHDSSQQQVRSSRRAVIINNLISLSREVGEFRCNLQAALNGRLCVAQTRRPGRSFNKTNLRSAAVSRRVHRAPRRELEGPRSFVRLDRCLRPSSVGRGGFRRIMETSPITGVATSSNTARADIRTCDAVAGSDNPLSLINVQPGDA